MPLRIDVPRDRASSFEPVLIPKHERRFTGFDDKIKPSRADEMPTRSLKQALALIDVRVVDHLVVAATGVTSFAEGGLI